MRATLAAACVLAACGETQDDDGAAETHADTSSATNPSSSPDDDDGPMDDTSAVDTSAGTDDGGSSSIGDPDEIPPDAMYVDDTIAAECTDYAPETRACGAGSSRAFATLASAAAAALPGDTVVIRALETNERFVVPSSGEPDAPIVYRRFPGETVTIRLPDGPFVPGIEVTDLHDVVLDGIDVDDAMMWGQILRSSRITVKNARFTGARDQGSRGGFRFVDSDHNRIIGNVFEDGNDNLFLEHSDYNLVEGNTLHRARHTLVVLACSSYNVVRGNELDNPDQKGSETFDCEGAVESQYDDTPQVPALDSTVRNVWEGNRFVGTRASESTSDYNAMQFSGQRGIVRRNVYWDNLGGAIGVQVYPEEALFNYHNRIYHNSVTANACFGIQTSSDDTDAYFGNVLVNNIAFGNVDCTNDGAADIVDESSGANDFVANLTNDPRFVDLDGRDLRLAADSPAIDTGAFLTTTTAAGVGTELPVVDAGFFYDGYGIAGEVGDTIRLEGDDATAIVIGLDDGAGVLQLDRALEWTAGQGVALDHEGAAPDVGAFEAR